jgi:hypothetical protein
MAIRPIEHAAPDERSRYRKCGRCRETFDSDPTLPPESASAFWLCARCRTILLPGRSAVDAGGA